jgi:ribonuclease HI
MSECSRIIVDACCHIPDSHLKNRIGYGKSACGVLIIDTKNMEYEHSKYLGDKTVPQAEFEGLLFALDKASEILPRNKEIEVWMDSELVVKWMNKEYKLKKEHIKILYDQACTLSQRFSNIKILHHSRATELAKRADRIAESEYKKHHK